MRRGAIAALMTALLGGSCGKVPITPVNAGFALADASWFEAEQTLFIFYQANAEQGIGDPNLIEITYATDDERVDWTPVVDFTTVHGHVPVDCGVTSLCGSTSIRVPIEPREVDIRLRYHRDGDLSLEADTVFNVVGAGEPHERSLVVYGVFDEPNQQVQWRGRHQFPTIRNEQATDLGLRRDFSVEGMAYGDAELTDEFNVYGYGVDCPGSFTDAGLAGVATDERAIFQPDPLPIEASDASTVCADSTVTDARGTFSAGVVARKNPETRSAFPVLRSPVHDATPLKFMLGPCNRVISSEHEAMQRQRLQLEGIDTYCIDQWDGQGFVDELAATFVSAIEAARPAGNDMVLVVGLHQDDPDVAEAVEAALLQVVPQERHRATPRLAGAFVFDSTTRGLEDIDLAPSTLWCPATIPTDTIPDASARTCPTLPDFPDINLGPFSFGNLQILPNRRQYLDFLEEYSDGAAGEVTLLQYLTPEFTTTSDHVDLGEFGVITFLNGESIAADPDDAFSYCVQEEATAITVRSTLLQDPFVQEALAEACLNGEIDQFLCGFLASGVIPLEQFPAWHNDTGESSYDVGLYWQFPFLLRMEYTAFLAGSATAFGVSVPFGFASPSESFFGTDQWTQDEFSLDPELLQCRRFCDHPTFDSAGVYNVTDPFRETYATACYRPDYPQPGDSGFPIDP